MKAEKEVKDRLFSLATILLKKKKKKKGTKLASCGSVEARYHGVAQDEDWQLGLTGLHQVDVL